MRELVNCQWVCEKSLETLVKYTVPAYMINITGDFYIHPVGGVFLQIQWLLWQKWKKKNQQYNGDSPHNNKKQTNSFQFVLNSQNRVHTSSIVWFSTISTCIWIIRASANVAISQKTYSKCWIVDASSVRFFIINVAFFRCLLLRCNAQQIPSSVILADSTKISRNSTKYSTVCNSIASQTQLPRYILSSVNGLCSFKPVILSNWLTRISFRSDWMALYSNDTSEYFRKFKMPLKSHSSVHKRSLFNFFILTKHGELTWKKRDA